MSAAYRALDERLRRIEGLLAMLEGVLIGGVELKPHGRLAWAIRPGRTARHDMWYVDLSVMPPNHRACVEAERIRAKFQADDQPALRGQAPSTGSGDPA